MISCLRDRRHRAEVQGTLDTLYVQMRQLRESFSVEQFVLGRSAGGQRAQAAAASLNTAAFASVTGATSKRPTEEHKLGPIKYNVQEDSVKILDDESLL